MKESQARALEEVAKKNRVTLETALNNAEKDKNRLLAVSTHTHTHTGTCFHCFQGQKDIQGWPGPFIVNVPVYTSDMTKVLPDQSLIMK